MYEKPYVRPSDRPTSASVQVGRFTVLIKLSRTASDQHEMRAIGAARKSGEDVVYTVSKTDGALGIVWKLNEIQEWSDHLDVQDRIASDPAKYEAIAKKVIASEDAEKAARVAAQAKVAEGETETARALWAKQRAEAEAKAKEELARQHADEEAARLERQVYAAARSDLPSAA